MTDLETIELVARRLAERESQKCSNGGITNVDYCRTFRDLDDELARIAAERAKPR